MSLSALRVRREARAFAVTPRLTYVQIATANTNRDGTGAVSTVVTGASTGTKVERIVVEATGTTTAGMARLFISNDSGTTIRLIDEFSVTAITVSATVAAYRVERRYDDLVLPDTSSTIRCSTHNAETFNVFAFGADL